MDALYDLETTKTNGKLANPEDNQTSLLQAQKHVDSTANKLNRRARRLARRGNEQKQQISVDQSSNPPFLPTPNMSEQENRIRLRVSWLISENQEKARNSERPHSTQTHSTLTSALHGLHCSVTLHCFFAGLQVSLHCIFFTGMRVTVAIARGAQTLLLDAVGYLSRIWTRLFPFSVARSECANQHRWIRHIGIIIPAGTIDPSRNR